MPFGKWRNFDDCVADFIRQGKTEEQAKRICGALQARLEAEAAGRMFNWEGEISPWKGSLIHGKAIHPVKTVHPEEWPGLRVYLEEELRKAAGSLVGAPLLLDHIHPLDGEVLHARYVDGAVEYIARLDDPQVLSWVKDGTIKHCSVEYVWDSLERVNGVAPRGITFTGLALLKEYEPGDPETTVQTWEAIVERLKEAAEAASSSNVEKDLNVEAALEAVNSAVAELAEKIERNNQRLLSRITVLERIVADKKPTGEGVIDPSTSRNKTMISKSVVLDELRRACYERVPKHWSYGAYLQNRRLKDLIRKLENSELEGEP